MKKIFVIIIIICHNLTFSQESISQGKVEYEMILSLNELNIYKAELIFNNKISQFNYTNLTESSESTDNFGNINITVSDSVPRIIYNDIKNFKLYHYTNLLTAKERTWIEEPTPKIEWVLLDETKKIGNLICNKATSFFRGRKYTVWYATEIKNSFGPWKLQGLPGMILEAYDDEKEVVFNLKKITIPFNSLINITPTETVSIENVKQIQKEKTDELIKKIESKLERGDTIKIKVNNKAQIERN